MKKYTVIVDEDYQAFNENCNITLDEIDLKIRVCFPQAGHFPFILDECAVIFFHYTITIRACESGGQARGLPQLSRACRSSAPWP